MEVGKPSKLLHYWEWPEYWEESWRLEGTCCHSKSSERPVANADVKNSNEQIIIIIIIVPWKIIDSWKKIRHGIKIQMLQKYKDKKLKVQN